MSKGYSEWVECPRCGGRMHITIYYYPQLSDYTCEVCELVIPAAEAKEMGCKPKNTIQS